MGRLSQGHFSLGVACVLEVVGCRFTCFKSWPVYLSYWGLQGEKRPVLWTEPDNMSSLSSSKAQKVQEPNRDSLTPSVEMQRGNFPSLPLINCKNSFGKSSFVERSPPSGPQCLSVRPMGGRLVFRIKKHQNRQRQRHYLCSLFVLIAWKLSLERSLKVWTHNP